MNEEKKHIKGESAGANLRSSGYGFDSNMWSDMDDASLFGDISSFMKAKLDIEDVKNDPNLNSTRDSVKEMISDYNSTVSENRKRNANEKFVRESVSDDKTEEAGRKEIDEIKLESSKSGINLVTADWVKEWHLKKQMAGTSDPKTKEIKDFITSSLAGEQAGGQEEVVTIKKKGISRSLFIRYISLSAAAIIGAVLIINTLLPSTSPQELFDSYYKPFNAISPVTRGAVNSTEDLYSTAINNYKSGDYESAIENLSTLMLKDPSSLSPLFFIGLSEIELGNYTQAIADLNSVVFGSVEYAKEAEWYLGLLYLKTGDKLRAEDCFRDMVNHSEFYRARAEKILRRLK